MERHYRSPPKMSASEKQSLLAYKSPCDEAQRQIYQIGFCGFFTQAVNFCYKSLILPSFTG